MTTASLPPTDPAGRTLPPPAGQAVYIPAGANSISLPPGMVQNGGVLALPTGVSNAPPSDFGSGHSQVNVLKAVHAIFRGRYVMTAILAGAGLIAGGIAGWLTRKPEYVAVATVQVQQQQLTLQGGESVMPAFQSFVNRQIEYLTHPRTVRQAVTSAEWSALGRGTGPDAEIAMRSAVSVRQPRGTNELIYVSFADRDPRVAFVGATELIRAYQSIFAETDGQVIDRARLQVIQDQRATTEARIQSTRRQIETLAQTLGTDNPRAIDNFLLSKRLDLETRITALEIQLRQMGIDPGIGLQPGTTGPGGANATGNPDGSEPDGATTEEASMRAAEALDKLSYEEIAVFDPPTADLVMRLRAAQQQRQQLLDMGLAEQHRRVVRQDNELRSLTQQLEDRKQSLRAGEGNSSSASGQAPAPIVGGADTPEGLRRQLEGWRMDLARVREQQSALAGRMQELESLTRLEELDRQKLQEFQRTEERIRIDRSVEQQVGRISVIPPDGQPTTPDDNNRKKFAVLFAMLGAAIPIGIIGAIGLADRRYRYSDQAIEEGPTNATLLGILPKLPEDLADAEQASAAAHCVHQIRTLVQLAGRSHQVYAVTSSNPGDGKTSLTLALGISFAGSGSRTLLVDFDLIGQGLSRELRLREQSSLFEAVQRGEIAERIKATPIERLSLLPTGTQDDHRTANRLAEPQITRVLDAVRDDYDVILIDTGPVLGSIEAHLVCAQADGVILVIGAGRAKGQVKAAVEQLRRVRARLLGLVFNLARSSDFRASAASQSFRSVRPDGTPPQRPAPTDYPDLDPLPRVVAMDTKKS